MWVYKSRVSNARAWPFEKRRTLYERASLNTRSLLLLLLQPRHTHGCIYSIHIHIKRERERERERERVGEIAARSQSRLSPSLSVSRARGVLSTGAIMHVKSENCAKRCEKLQENKLSTAARFSYPAVFNRFIVDQLLFTSSFIIFFLHSFV